MGSVPVFPKDPYGGAYGASPQLATQVDELIGSAYDVVRHVAENIEYVKHVSHHLAEIYELSQHTEAIDALYENIENLEILLANLNDMLIVAANIDAVNDVAGSIDAVNTVSDNINELLIIQENMLAFLSVLRDFATRADLIAHIAAYPAGTVAGRVYNAGGYQYVGSPGSTAIPDMPGLMPLDPPSVVHFGALGNGTTNNTTAFQAAEVFTNILYVPPGTYRLTSPFSLNFSAYYYGPGVLQFDQADHRRRGGSSGDPLVTEHYTVAYEFASQSDVHLYFDDVESPILLWVGNATFEASGDSGGKLVVVRVVNGKLRLTETPQQIASRNMIGSGGSKIVYDPATAVANSHGGDNTSFGSRALLHAIHSNNTAVGAQALMTSDGGNCTAMGFQALYRSNGASNTAIGSVSMEWSTTGANNTAVGAGAGAHNTTGNNNTWVGWYAGSDNQAGDHNVCVGYRAGTNVGTTAIYSSVLIGAYAGDLSHGSSNVAIGYRAHNSEGNADSTGTLNIAIGRDSMRAVNSGSNNVAVGATSLRNVSEGNDNIAVGHEALIGVTTGSANVAVGAMALHAMSTGGTATAVGYHAAMVNTVGSTTAVGYQALALNTTGADNVAVGRDALGINITGSYNIAIGHLAMSSVVTDSNVGVGYRAGQANATGARNTSVGFEACRLGASGDDRVVVGHRAGRVTVGNDNTALGSDALLNNTTGTNNTALGRLALAVDQAAVAQTTYVNTTGVGSNSKVSGSNQVQLGDSATTTYAYGAVQARSDERDKADIQDTTLGLDFVLALRPVDYRWDMREDYAAINPDTGESVLHERDGTHKRSRFHHGFIAQEVAALNPDFGGYQDHKINGGIDVLSLGYEELIAPLVKAIQQLTARVAELEANR